MNLLKGGYSVKATSVLRIFLGVWFAAIAVSSLTGCKRTTRHKGPLNVILISVDTLRADRLGCYGYKEASTPHMDALARDGTLFERVVSQAPITLPSHATMLTGLSPATHAVHDNGTYRLPEKHRTLAEILQEEGYKTGAVIGGFPLAAQFGTDQGFEFYSDKGLRSHVVRRSPDPERQVMLRGTPADRPADAVTRDALRWVSTVSKEEPYFLFVHYYDPHAPYEPPEEYLLRHDSPYDGEIAFTDAEIGRLLDGISSRGLLERTIVVLTSDHGEGLGDHGELTHGYLLHDSTLRVPLLFKGTGVPAGRRVQELAAVADIVPTVLELLGHQPGTLDGRSLVQAMKNKSADQERQVYSECLLPHFSHHCYPIRSVTTELWRYIDAGEDELFHLARDPEEDRNLASDHPNETLALKSALNNVPLLQDPDARNVLSQQDAEELRNLGYLGSGDFPAEEIQRQGRNPREIVPVLSIFNRAQGEMRNYRFREAKALLGEALGRLPGDPDVLEEMALCCFALGDLEQAERYAQGALTMAPTRPRARNTLARCHSARGDWTSALAVYEEGARLVAQTQPYLFHFEIADCHFRLGDIDKALVLAEQAAGQKDVASAKVEYAAFLIESAQWSKLQDLPRGEQLLGRALETLREAIVLDPYNVRAFYHLGLYFMYRDRPYSALAFFQRALRIDPAHTESHNNAAGCYLQVHRFSDALRHFEYLIDHNPTLVSPKIGRACALFSRGRTAEAVDQLETLLQEHPQDPKILYNLSFCYEQLGRADEAMTGYRLLLQILPERDPLRGQAEEGIRALTRPEEPRES